MEENFSMEWNMEENFSMEWKFFGMEWKWNGRKLPVSNIENSSSIPFHTMPCPLCGQTFFLTCKGGEGGGACRNFAYYSMQLNDPGDPKGGPWLRLFIKLLAFKRLL